MLLKTEIASALKSKILGMMVFRVVIALVFLGVTVWFQLSEASLDAPFLYPLHSIVVVIGLLTILYSLLINIIKNLKLFAYIQVVIDVCVITAVIYVTGGMDSFLASLYVFSVIGASIVIGRNGGLVAASASSILYGLLIDLDYYKVLPQKYKLLWSPVDHAWDDVVTTIILNIVAFFSVAYLTGYLAEKTAKIEKKLEEKEIDYDRLEVLNSHIVDNITSGIITLDSDERITSFNKGAEVITGLSLKDVYFKPLDEVFKGMLISDTHLPLGEGGRVDKLFNLKTGEKWLGYNISFGSGKDVEYIVLIQDLTLYKKLEDELRRDDRLKSLGELSASLAHEIRNPLASLSGSIQVLGEDLKLDGDKQNLMDIVLRESKRLNGLITDFLLFARPAGEIKEKFDLSKVIKDTVGVFSNSPEGVGLNVVDKVEDSIVIEGDKRQITQVFWNLFINAGSAMKSDDSVEGTLKIGAIIHRANSDASDSGSGDILISVKDSGVGIDSDDVDNIFNPFFSTKEAGTGLGLAIVNRIIDSHGGTITVNSSKGGGTEFIIKLPIIAESV